MMDQMSFAFPESEYSLTVGKHHVACVGWFSRNMMVCSCLIQI